MILIAPKEIPLCTEPLWTAPEWGYLRFSILFTKTTVEYEDYHFFTVETEVKYQEGKAPLLIFE